MSRQKVTPYRNLDLGATGQVVKASPCKLSSYYFYNNGATIRYVKLYDKVTAATFADTPIFTIPVPANNGANLNLNDAEWPFANGLSIRATQGVADNDNTAPSTNEVIVNIGTVENLSYTL